MMLSRWFSKQGSDLVDFLAWLFDFSKITKEIWTSPRKQIFFGAYIIIAAAIINVILLFGDRFEVYSRSHILHLFIILFAIEPCFLVAQAIVLRLTPMHLDHTAEKEKEDNRNIGVIITCHRSEEEIVETVKACLLHFDSSQIFVLDNSNAENDGHKTQKALLDADLHSVHYIFQMIGNKTLAIYAGAIAAKDFDFLLMMDDDTRLPPEMVFDEGFFGRESVKAVCYPIRAIGPRDPGEESMLVKWQELEYKICDYSKQFQSRFSTVLYPHGAISLWERETLIKCLRDHDTVFYGDDVKMGLWLQQHNYKMMMDHRYVIDTESHITWSGLYQQRVRSWDMAEHVLTPKHCNVLLKMRHPNHDYLGIVVLKWFQLYACFCIVVDWIRIPALVVTFWFSPGWQHPVLVLVGLTVATILAYLLWDWVAAPGQQRRSHWIVILTYPLYKIPTIFQRWMALGVAYLEYLPNFRRKPTIVELEDRYANDNYADFNPRCPIWLRSWDFEYGFYFRHYDRTTPCAVKSTSTDQPLQSSGQDAQEKNTSIARHRPVSTEEVQLRTSSVPQLSKRETKVRNCVLQHLKSGCQRNIVPLLEKFPRIVQLKDTSGNHLVHIACMSATPYSMLRAIVEASPRKVPTNQTGDTALHLACREGATKRIVELLVNKWEAAKYMPNKMLRRPLHLAVGTSLEVVKFLVKSNRNAVSQRDIEGNYPLHCACDSVPDWEVAEYLIRKFPFAVFGENAQGNLPLHLACEDPDNWKLVQSLVEVNPDSIMVPNKQGQLPIHIACRSGFGIDVVENLYSPKHVQVVDVVGNTPLHALCACTRAPPDADLIAWILSLDPLAPQKPNKEGCLPIHLLCASIGSVESRNATSWEGKAEPSSSAINLIRALEHLKSHFKKSVLVRDNNGRTPLYVACSTGALNLRTILPLLRDVPRETIRTKDRKGYSVVHRACTHRHVSVATLRCLLHAAGEVVATSHERRLTSQSDAGSSLTSGSSTPPLDGTSSRTSTEPTCLSDTSTILAKNREYHGDGTSFASGCSSLGDGSTDMNDWWKTASGDTPLHLAYRYEAPDEVISFLSHFLPELTLMRNEQGLTPQELHERLVESREREAALKDCASMSSSRSITSSAASPARTETELECFPDTSPRHSWRLSAALMDFYIGEVENPQRCSEECRSFDGDSNSCSTEIDDLECHPEKCHILGVNDPEWYPEQSRSFEEDESRRKESVLSDPCFL